MCPRHPRRVTGWLQSTARGRNCALQTVGLQSIALARVRPHRSPRLQPPLRSSLIHNQPSQQPTGHPPQPALRRLATGASEPLLNRGRVRISIEIAVGQAEQATRSGAGPRTPMPGLVHRRAIRQGACWRLVGTTAGHWARWPVMTPATWNGWSEPRRAGRSVLNSTRCYGHKVGEAKRRRAAPANYAGFVTTPRAAGECSRSEARQGQSQCSAATRRRG